MKLFFKILASLFIIILVVIGGFLSYLKIALPNVGNAPVLKVPSGPAFIERGKYLAHHVTACIDCHSTRDWSKFAGPVIDGTFGKGGEAFDNKAGFPGTYYAKNITPYNLKNWTDGEILRAITTGVSKNVNALFPVMPYHYYGNMDQEDLNCIIAYVRSLEPIKNEVPESKSDFPMNFIINTLPKKASPNKRPLSSDTLAYGSYLTNAAACMECHTKQEKGERLEGMDFAGGFEFPIEKGTVRSSNITPDQSGIGSWTKEQFISRFKSYADSNSKKLPIPPNGFNTIMPWTMYAGMTEEDLGAIFTYLKTIKPVANSVVKFSASTQNTQ